MNDKPVVTFTSSFTTHPTIRALVKGDGAAEVEDGVIETRPCAWCWSVHNVCNGVCVMEFAGLIGS